MTRKKNTFTAADTKTMTTSRLMINVVYQHYHDQQQQQRDRVHIDYDIDDGDGLVIMTSEDVDDGGHEHDRPRFCRWISLIRRTTQTREASRGRVIFIIISAKRGRGGGYQNQRMGGDKG